MNQVVLKKFGPRVLVEELGALLHRQVFSPHDLVNYEACGARVGWNDDQLLVQILDSAVVNSQSSLRLHCKLIFSHPS